LAFIFQVNNLTANVSFEKIIVVLDMKISLR